MSPTAGRVPSAVIGLVAAAGVVVVVAGLKLASGILAPVLFAATLAILFTPLLRWLERRGLPTALALLAMVVGVVALVGGLLLVVYASLLTLQARLPAYQALLANRLVPLNELLGRLGISAAALPAGWGDGSALVSGALNTLTGLVSGAVGIVFFLFTLVLMLIESASIERKLRACLRPDNPFRQQLVGFTGEIQQQFRIQGLTNLLSAAALTAEFLLFRIDYALLWGFLAFVLAVIPNFGLILACLPAALLAFILHGPGTAVAVLAVGIALSAAVGNIVTPRLMASGLQLPVLVAFLSFLFWGWVFGFLGALLAIPATLFVRALLASSPETRPLAAFLSGAPPADAPADVAVPAGGLGDRA